jgi:hypothetical protein
MSVFTVELENKLGELARLCEAMAENKVNMVLSAVASGDEGTVMFVADDENAAHAALQEADLRYATRPALTILMENQPGAGAMAFRRLADAGVSTDLLLPVRVSDELFYAVICVDDEQKARHALGDIIVSASSAR